MTVEANRRTENLLQSCNFTRNMEYLVFCYIFSNTKRKESQHCCIDRRGNSNNTNGGGCEAQSVDSSSFYSDDFELSACSKTLRIRLTLSLRKYFALIRYVNVPVKSDT